MIDRQLRAWGTVYTRDDRETVLQSAESVTAHVFATAVIDGRTVRHSVGDWGPIKFASRQVAIDFEGNSPADASGFRDRNPSGHYHDGSNSYRAAG